MRRKTSVPEIHSNGHRGGLIQQTVHREDDRMDTNGGAKGRSKTIFFQIV